jgi:hypothetical protein
VKKHTTVTITLSMLCREGACKDGRNDVQLLLPAKLSTDPERNFALAFKLADSWWADHGRDHVYWLGRTVGISYNDLLPDGDILASNNSLRTQIDAYLVAQQLAMIADTLATKAGR